MAADADAQSALYTELASVPSYAAAQFAGASGLRVVTSTKDHTRNVKTTSERFFLIPTAIETAEIGARVPALAADAPAVPASVAQDSSDIVASTLSPSGRRRAVLREVGPDNKRRFVQVWLGARLETTLEVTGTHGPFIVDDHLRTLSFGPSETQLLYTAEAHAPKASPADPDARFRFQPTFGEGLPFARPTLFLLRWRSLDAEDTDTGTAPTVHALALAGADAPPLAVHFGQSVFATDSRVYATGHALEADGMRLGLKGCQNRPGGIWMLDIPAISERVDQQSEDMSAVDFLVCRGRCISAPDRSCRSPRVVSTDGSGHAHTLFYLSNTLGGPHASCASLHSVTSIQVEEHDRGDVLVDTIWIPDGPEYFPGLFVDHWLPREPFLALPTVDEARKTSPYVLLHSIWGSRTVVLLVAAHGGAVVNLTPEVDLSEVNGEKSDVYSWTVLGTDARERVVCTRSTPVSPPELVLGRIAADLKVSWTSLEIPVLSRRARNALATLSARIIRIPDRPHVEAVLIQGSTDSKVPCVTVIHGGPHGTSTTALVSAQAALACAGYTVLVPNYTGSLGHGQRHVEALLGQCGSLDVEDCLACVQHLIASGSASNAPGKLFVQGGSHGGFVSAHLIGQYPEFFTAAVIRNPVVSVGESGATDIPDWYRSEFALPVVPATVPLSPSSFETLQRASPIVHALSVRATVLLLIGEDDRRVAPGQGKAYYHALRSAGKECEMLCFPGEGHPLEGVEASRVAWEAGARLFARLRR